MKQLKMKILTTTISLISILASFGQKASITGIVKTDENVSLNFASVAIYSQDEKQKPIKAVYTDQHGVFSFNNIDTGRYFVLVSFTGFANNKIEFVINDRDTLLTLPEIVMIKSSKEMQNVTVTAQKKLIEIKDDGIVYNAEADPMAGSDKLIDLLRKAPFVTITADGSVEINGQSNFKILLNGRETSMFARNQKEAIRSFPGKLVKSIEIITSPSAKYDAEGIGGIINIITKKKVLGYNGSVSVEANSRSYRGLNASLNMKYGKIGFTAFAYAGGNINPTPIREEQKIIPLIPAGFSERKVEGYTRNLTDNPDMNFELTYEPDSLRTIAFYGSGSWTRQRDYSDLIYSTYFSPGSGPEMIFLSTFTRRSNPGWTSGLDYIYHFRKNKEREFSLKLFNSTGKQFIYGNSDQTGADSRYLRNENDAEDNQFTLQADYIQPLKKKKKLESGFKMIFRNARSNYNSYSKFAPNDNYTINGGNSDNFSYKQNVYSGYSNFSFSVRSFNFRTGLRVEHTAVDGDFVSTSTTVEQRYTHFVPNILVATRFKNRHFFTFTYSLRLSRPYIYHLNPFKNNIDSFHVYTGNPDLRPQVFHNTIIQYRFTKGNTFLNFSLGNSYSSSYVIYSFLFNETSGAVVEKPLNDGASNRVFLNVSANLAPVKTWRFNLNGGIAYQTLKSRSVIIASNNGFTGNMGYNTSLNIFSGFSATNFFNYYFPYVLAQGSVNGYFAYGFGGRYNLLKDKLTISAYLNNPFNKQGIFRRIRTFRDDNFSKQTISYSQFRSFGATLSYNFGKLKENVSKKKGVQNNDLL